MEKWDSVDVIKDLWVAYVYTCTCVYAWSVDLKPCPQACLVEHY